MMPTRHAFPTSLPASLSDAGEIRRNDWAAFRGVATLDDHWSLRNWDDNYSAYYWYLTFDDGELANLARRCQAALPTEYLDPVPVDGLHMTVLKVGPSAAVSSFELDAIAADAAERLESVDAFSITIGPLAGSKGAARFSVTPWTDLFRLHHELAKASLRPGASPVDTSLFRPHLGIAYSNCRRPTDELVECVEQLRSIPPVVVPVSSVDLVEVRREGQQYRWANRHKVVLRDANSGHYGAAGAENSFARVDHSRNASE
ncbi:2'-5' RNA ligase family protein [Antrihabitans sp. YC2-6]|uniref:2'-5' RNA ligase family protein n=1 Tax=Antrihabitans sp. YC2-6 TaxID=2799498 RepID=UPI0018F41973|nr:2'-5' RNA ligase family protein [Antrihabitans sp. YC2-6]MBJ8344514.1 2'-5' RNA ligase family protein [Antrihabitans sp. YC2-6]